MIALLLLVVQSAHAEDVVDNASLARKFLAERLTVAPLQITTITTSQYGSSTSSVNLWTVYRGENTMVGAKEFAEQMKDEEVLAKMQRQQTTGLAVGIPVTVAGAGLLGYAAYDGLTSKRFNAGIVLGGAGAGLVLSVVGVNVMLGPSRKQKWVKLYYTEEKANELVDGYNAAMLQDLGLTKEDLLRYLQEKVELRLEVHPFVTSNMIGVAGTF